MRSFAENAKVLEVFKSTALSKAFIPNIEVFVNVHL